MSNSVYKFYSNSLASGYFTLVDYIPLDTVNANTLFISHSIDTLKSNSYSIPFTIAVSQTAVPYLQEAEMVISIREKVDFVARGPNDITIKNIGKDIGKGNYKDYVPLRQSDLPSGFVELKGINE
jgi:hypothetical protein